jgi:hypothetical protein
MHPFDPRTKQAIPAKILQKPLAVAFIRNTLPPLKKHKY